MRVGSQLPLLKAEQAQFLQLFPIREMLQASDHLCYPLLNLHPEIHGGGAKTLRLLLYSAAASPSGTH